MTPASHVTGLINGTVITMDSKRTIAEAVLIEDGRIALVGDSRTVDKLCKQKNGQILEMTGRTILPGLEDCHVHMMGTGLNASGVDLFDCGSIAEVLEKVNTEALRVGPEKWVFCNRIDESRLKEKRPPFAAELDKVAPKNPVYVIDRGRHYAVVNDKAFSLMGLTPDMPVDVRLWWCTEDVEQIAQAGLPRQGKDIMLDGSIGSHTAAFSVPYADAPGEKGILYYPNERVEQFIEAAHLKGIQIGFHAIGEGAIKQALNAYEKVLTRHPSADHRHIIDHFGFVDHSAVDKAAELGIVISTQPSFMFLRGGPDSVYRTRLGEERERRGYPLREFLDAGIVVAGGSDSDVTPIDPILGIHAAVNQPYPESSVKLDEAIRMFTIDAAWSNREEDRKGSIENGKNADLTVLSDNPFEVPSTAINSIEVLLTLKGGRITYQK